MGREGGSIWRQELRCDMPRGREFRSNFFSMVMVGYCGSAVECGLYAWLGFDLMFIFFLYLAIDCFWAYMACSCRCYILTLIMMWESAWMRRRYVGDEWG